MPREGDLSKNAGQRLRTSDPVNEAHKCQQVEVPGIEPGSFGTKTGLLRAYFANRLLDPGYHTNK
jgi:hypothetical protein